MYPVGEAGKRCRAEAPPRGIAIDNSKSINLCKLHESRFVTLATQLTVLCQQWGIDAANGIVDRVAYTGLCLFLAPSGGALAERFRGVANAQIEGLCAFYRGYIKVRIASAVPPIAMEPKLRKLAATKSFRKINRVLITFSMAFS